MCNQHNFSYKFWIHIEDFLSKIYILEDFSGFVDYVQRYVEDKKQNISEENLKTSIGNELHMHFSGFS